MKARSPSSKRGYLSGGRWVAHRLDMLMSPAWRACPAGLRKVLDLLEADHIFHGGRENGNLGVSYSQFVAGGVSKKDLLPLLEVGEALGLIVVSRPDELIGNIRQANRYRLTYLPAKKQTGPTDEWQYVSTSQANDALERFRARRHSEADQVDHLARER